MNNRMVIPIGVLIAAILIIAGGYMIFKGGDSGKNTAVGGDGNENFTEETSAIIPDVKVEAEELKLNAELPFKVGNKYTYEYKFTIPSNLTESFGGGGLGSGINMKMSGSIDVDVDREERCNKSDCIVLKYLSVMKFENMDEIIAASGMEIGPQEMQMIKMYKEGINITGESWINREGKTLKTKQNIFGMEITTEGEKAESSSMTNFGPNLIVEPWMLALNENFEWSRNTTMEIGGISGGSFATTEKYGVVDVEDIETKAGKRKCYKVEADSLSSTKASEGSGNTGMKDSKFSGKSIMWVDYNKRILVKEESWIENLNIGSVDLVYEK